MQQARSQIGRYFLAKRLGDGPHGTVFLAKPAKKSDPQRVIKLLEVPATGSLGLAALERDRARLEIEHPNLVVPLEAGRESGEDGDRLFLVSDYVDGPDLFRFTARAAWNNLFEVLVSLLRALEALHVRGMRHGHLVASNVLVWGQGPRKSARLTDPGFADEIWETRCQAGVRSFAPEVLEGHAPDRRADLYDLGVLLYECATRSPLFPDAGDDEAALIAAHRSSEPTPARELRRSVPVALEATISMLLAKDPAQRPPSANAVIRELNRAANKRFSLETRDPSLGLPLRPQQQLHPAPLATLSSWAHGQLSGTAEASPLALVEGPAGSGKTTLLGELAGGLGDVAGLTLLRPQRPTFAGLVATAAELAAETDTPLLPRAGEFLSELLPSALLERVARKAPPLEHPGRERRRRIEGALRLLHELAERKPLLLVLDDAQRADPLLLDLLETLAESPGASPAGTRETGDDGDERPLPRWPQGRGSRRRLAAVLASDPDEAPGLPAEAALARLRSRPGTRLTALASPSEDDLMALILGACGRDGDEEAAEASRSLAAAADGSPTRAMALVTALARQGYLPAPDGSWVWNGGARALAELAEAPALLTELLEDRPREVTRLLVVHERVAGRCGPLPLTVLALALGQEPEEVLGAVRELERYGWLETPPLASGGSVGSAPLSLGSPALVPLLLELDDLETAELHDALGGAAAQRAAELAEDSLSGSEAGADARALAEVAAAHFSLGANPRRALPWTILAADAALARRDPLLASELLEGAARQLDRPGGAGEGLPGALRSVLNGGLEYSLWSRLADSERALQRLDSARAAVHKALAAAREARRPNELAEAQLLLARVELERRELPAARAAAAEAVELAVSLDWRRGHVQAVLTRAQIEQASGDRAQAASSYDEALAQAAGDAAEQATALGGLASLRVALGDLQGALEAAELARELADEGTCAARLADALTRLSELRLRAGETEAAAQVAERACAAAADTLDAMGLAQALTAWSRAAARRGELAWARELEERALALWQRVRHEGRQAASALRLGQLLAGAGQLQAAAAQLTRAGRSAKQMGERVMTSHVDSTQARLHLLSGELALAEEEVERALQEAEAAEDGSARVAAREVKAALALATGDLTGAEEGSRQAAEEAARQGETELEARARVTLALALLQRGRPAEAERELREAAEQARLSGNDGLGARASLGLARVHLVRGEPTQGLREVERARDVAKRQQDTELELRSVEVMARLHLFLGQGRRAASLLRMARQRAEEVGLKSFLPEAQRLAALAELDEAGRAGPEDPEQGQASAPATADTLGEVSALLEQSQAAVGARRGQAAALEVAWAQRALAAGDPGEARERAEVGLEGARLIGDAQTETEALLILSRARRGQGRHEDALTNADEAYEAATGMGHAEAAAAALLARGRARQALGRLVPAAHDLREASSLVRGVWAALPEDLRADYGQRRLAREIVAAAGEVAAQVEAVSSLTGGSTSGSTAGLSYSSSGLDASTSGSSASIAAVSSGSFVGDPFAAAIQAGQKAAAGVSSSSESGIGSVPSDGEEDQETLRDPLTNLFNHTFFTAQLDTELKRAQRHSRPLALLKTNVDRFKLVRELYGARTGKRVIRDVANLLLRNVRDVDIVARYFGDEFEVLLPDTDQRGALLTAERIREAVAEHSFQEGDEKIDLTITMGVALFPRDAKDKDSLVCRVDEALYNARSRGSNQVFAFGGPDEPVGESDPELRELDQLLLTREGRTILSMVSRIVNQELDVDRVIEVVTGMVVEATRGERGFIMLKGPKGEFTFRHGRNIDDKVINSPELKISNGIAKEVAATGQPIHVQEALDDNRFRDFKSVMDLGLRSIVCAPIKLGDEVLGVIYVDHNQVARNFNQEDLNFLTAIAGKVAIPIKNSKRLRDTEDRLEMAEARLKSQAAQLQTKYSYDNIIGRTEAMQKVFKLLDRIVETNHSVVIHGESGTGKELIARAIHYNGARKTKPFVAENCAAMADSLLEAELFGHVKGAFTGADKDAKGLFELANGGTLFLDEIGDMSERMQKKLLRVLQEGEVRPVGGKRVFHVDVRVISASHQNLKQLVAERKFREDLYYRLNVITVQLPPLRERRDDIVLLVEHFLAKQADKGEPRTIDRETMRALINYDWPGNVRELENEVSRLVAMSDDMILPEALSPKIREGSAPEGGKGDGLTRFYNRSLKEVEHEFMREVLLNTLEQTNWHRTKAAKILKVPTSTLFNKMKKYGIG